MPPPSGKRYNISCYQVLPKADRIVLQKSSGIFPESRDNFRLYNIGRVPVRAQAKYGTAAQWLGTICGRTVKPGQSEILEVGDNPYYVTGIYIANDYSEGRVLVHAGYEGNEYPWYDDKEDNWELDIDIDALAKDLVQFGVGKIPVVGEYLSILVGFFWPERKVSVWDQVKEQVKNLLDERTNETIRGILGGDIRYYKERITSLKQDMERGRVVSTHFMNIAEDLIGFERKFAFDKDDNSKAGQINYLLLPMFSSLVSLKMTYYQFGILNREKIGLTQDDVQRLKDYSRTLIEGTEGAMKHVTSVLNERVDYELNTCNPDHVFDALVTVRTYCGLNGTEFIAYWKHILKHPESKAKPYNDVITYSTGFGRPTPIQARQIVPEEVERPLQPDLIEGKRNRIAGLDVWMWRSDNGRGEPKIGGLKIYCENGDMYEMGGWSAEKHYIHFKKAYCTRLTAYGDGALDYLEFALSDGRVLGYGTKSEATNIKRDFELANHHIAGIYVGNDIAWLGGRAVNIAVSFQLTPEE